MVLHHGSASVWAAGEARERQEPAHPSPLARLLTLPSPTRMPGHMAICLSWAMSQLQVAGIGHDDFVYTSFTDAALGNTPYILALHR